MDVIANISLMFEFISVVLEMNNLFYKKDVKAFSFQ